MRIESSVTSLSWIPSEAIGGMTKMPFETGVAHYDPPPPDVIEDIDALQRDGRFRFASRLTAWIDVEDGRHRRPRPGRRRPHLLDAAAGGQEAGRLRGHRPSRPAARARGRRAAR